MPGVIHFLRTLAIALSLYVPVSGVAQTIDDHSDVGNKVLYINSYHAGYPWSDGIERGIRSRFIVEDVWFKTHYMDAKRHRSTAEIEAAVLEAKKVINELNPDIVIVSDDVAVKYLLEPYYKNAALPFVYCGVNWDASVYGLPYKNTTGMVEVTLIESLTGLLSGYAGGNRIGFLSIDALSGRRTLENYQGVLNRDFDQAYLVNTVEEWEQKFIALQQQVDYMILASPEGILGWTALRAGLFVKEQARIPIGAAQQWLSPYALITIAKIPEEQGWWAADQALKILHGVAPASIPEAKNKQGELFVNLEMAERLGITLSAEILQAATPVNRPQAPVK